MPNNINRKNLNITSKVTLNNGVEMPLFGLGVLKAKEGGEVENAVKMALQHGYRKIDTSTVYRNERGVGKGIKLSGVPREEIFLITKLENEDQGYHSTFKAFEKSCERLQTDYIDLYLIHWPQEHKSIETWKAMEELYRQGRVRAIGVSNFLIYHLEYFLPHCEIIPAVNQVEFHPKLVQPELQEYCKSKGIQLQAWSPLMQGKIKHIPEIGELAKKYGKTPFQVVLRWNLQKGIATIPKTVIKKRIISNAGIFNFELSDEDVKRIDSLDENYRMIPHHYSISLLIQILFRQKKKLQLFQLLFITLIAKIRNRLIWRPTK
jgi:methylglyoxal/glyoxal reductase